MDVLRLTLRQLQIFSAVADSGSTTAASAAIALSQSATSSAVNELERLLGLRLFDRAGKRLLLNDNGRALLPRARAMLDAAIGVERMARSGQAQFRALRIGTSTTVGNYLMPRFMGELFSARGDGDPPGWHARIAIANTAAICRAVACFELDVGLIEGAPHEPELEAMPWVKDEMVVVARHERAPRGQAWPTLSLRDLRDAVWLMREEGSGTREATDQVLLPHLRSYRRSIEIGSSEAIKRAAAEGVGLACLSRWVVEDLIAARRLRVVDTTLPKLYQPCYVVTHRAKQITPALRALFGIVGAGAGSTLHSSAG
jgi:DNA-binding transcriptional LysR family regulator